MKKSIIPVCAAIVSALILNCSSDQVTMEQYQQELKNQNTVQETVPQDMGKDSAVDPMKDAAVQEPVQETKATLSLADKYSVEGKSAAGAAYNGVVNVAKKGESYQLTMKLKAKTITGNGTLDGNKLTVFWGKNRRFEYEVKDDGKIMSTWAKGQEIFTPEQ